MLLIMGVVNLLLGLIVAIFFSRYSPAGAVFSNGANNLLMGLTFGAWGGLGLCGESRSRLSAVLQTAFLVFMAVWVIVTIYGTIQLFTGGYWEGS